MTKILGLSLYGRQAASHRYRLGQYVPGLAQAGIDLQIQSLLDDEYLVRRFAGRPVPWGSVLQSAWQRLLVLIRSDGFEGAILQGELYPLMPGGLERLLLPKPYIYDFDDAFFLKYRQGRLSALQPILGQKFERVIAGASAVTAGNSHLSNYAQGFNANVHRLPTVVDTLRYLPQARTINSEFTVGWVGSPSTVQYLAALVEPLSQLAQEAPVRFVVVGGTAPLIPGVLVESITWDEATEINQINRFDVGVMPLTDDEWARGKCAFKLIQYMACGVPVVASRVGANEEVVTPYCGFLVENAADWLAALRALRDDAPRRLRMGVAARVRIEAEYSLARNLPVLKSVVQKMLGIAGPNSGDKKIYE
jgi:glycosyltransferase involved in cell wall biosynthesis